MPPAAPLGTILAKLLITATMTVPKPEGFSTKDVETLAAMVQRLDRLSFNLKFGAATFRSNNHFLLWAP
jgi:hypothetical protein